MSTGAGSETADLGVDMENTAICGLVVEGLNNTLGALSALEDNLSNDNGLRLKQLAAADKTTNGRDGALDVGSSSAGGKVLRHDGKGASKATDGHTFGGSGVGDGTLRSGSGLQLRLDQSLGDLGCAPLAAVGWSNGAGHGDARGQGIGAGATLLGLGSRRGGIMEVVSPGAIDVAGSRAGCVWRGESLRMISH